MSEVKCSQHITVGVCIPSACIEYPVRKVEPTDGHCMCYIPNIFAGCNMAVARSRLRTRAWYLFHGDERCGRRKVLLGNECDGFQWENRHICFGPALLQRYVPNFQQGARWNFPSAQSVHLATPVSREPIRSVGSRSG